MQIEMSIYFAIYHSYEFFSSTNVCQFDFYFNGREKINIVVVGSWKAKKPFSVINFPYNCHGVDYQKQYMHIEPRCWFVCSVAVFDKVSKGQKWVLCLIFTQVSMLKVLTCMEQNCRQFAMKLECQLESISDNFWCMLTMNKHHCLSKRQFCTQKSC